MAKIMQLAKDLLKGGKKENIYPKTIDTAVSAETVEGEESTVDQVYLKTANIGNVPLIQNLADHTETKVLSIEVTSESTEYEGDILVNSLTFNGEAPSITTVNTIINFILGNYNIKLQLYKYNSSRTTKTTVIELDMSTYSSQARIVGYKFLEGKRLLIIDDLVGMITAAMSGHEESTHYQAISLQSITQMTIDDNPIPPTENIDDQGNITSTINITAEDLAPLINKAIVLTNDGSFASSTDSIDTLKGLANERWSALGILPIFYTHLCWIQTGVGRNINLTLEYFTITSDVYTFVFGNTITVNNVTTKVTAVITEGDTKFTITTQTLNNGN